MEFSANQIAQLIQGRVEGDGNATVHTFAKIEEGVPGAISFLASDKYINYIYDTASTIVLVDESIEFDRAVKPTIIRVRNARDCVAKLLQLYESAKPRKTGIDPLAFVSPKAQVGENVYVGAFAYVGDGVVVGDNTQIYPHATLCDNAKVGADCIIYPQVTVYHDCVVGNRVILHSGAVIGADGFGFAPNNEHTGYDKIPQIGIVQIEDDVEIGANTCVDRSTMGATVVRKGVKLDNLVQIAHNTDIGENTVMSSQVGIAGSTKVGQWCMFGGQVGVSGHITIGDQVFLGAQSGVPSSIKSNRKLIGTPPMEQMPYFKSQAIFQKLPDLYKQLNALQKEVDELKKKQQDR
ncbi:MAG: UDP-3-O-(3-hydroxymyristoyl)glucosamine N-acyltransferase [Prevotella sp.]|nr:UDP-3-O-(3-hydroxymyristoyl)glucosamine N-acyltransferase [Prevotella sp.]